MENKKCPNCKEEKELVIDENSLMCLICGYFKSKSVYIDPKGESATFKGELKFEEFGVETLKTLTNNN